MYVCIAFGNPLMPGGNKKGAPMQVCSCKFCEILKNTFLEQPGDYFD